MKENSVASGRFRPRNKSKTMHAPEREVPGNAAATSCARPTPTAMPQVTSSLNERPLICASISRNATPPSRRRGRPGGSFPGASVRLSSGRSRRPGDEECEQELECVDPRCPYPPLEDELVESPVKQRNHRQHRAGLDDHIEELDCRGNQCSAISRCAVEETGRNSVIPSMIPRMITAKNSGMGGRRRRNPHGSQVEKPGSILNTARGGTDAKEIPDTLA